MTTLQIYIALFCVFIAAVVESLLFFRIGYKALGYLFAILAALSFAIILKLI